MNVCPRCGKVTKVDSIHTCTPQEVCEVEQKLNEILESDRGIFTQIIKKLRKPINNLTNK